MFFTRCSETALGVDKRLGQMCDNITNNTHNIVYSSRTYSTSVYQQVLYTAGKSKQDKFKQLPDISYNQTHQDNQTRTTNNGITPSWQMITLGLQYAGTEISNHTRFKTGVVYIEICT